MSESIRSLLNLQNTQPAAQAAPPTPVFNPATGQWEIPQPAAPEPPKPVLNPATGQWEIPGQTPAPPANAPAQASPPANASAAMMPSFNTEAVRNQTDRAPFLPWGDSEVAALLTRFKFHTPTRVGSVPAFVLEFKILATNDPTKAVVGNTYCLRFETMGPKADIHYQQLASVIVSAFRADRRTADIDQYRDAMLAAEDLSTHDLKVTITSRDKLTTKGKPVTERYFAPIN